MLNMKVQGRLKWVRRFAFAIAILLGAGTAVLNASTANAAIGNYPANSANKNNIQKCVDSLDGKKVTEIFNISLTLREKCITQLDNWVIWFDSGNDSTVGEWKSSGNGGGWCEPYGNNANDNTKLANATITCHKAEQWLRDQEDDKFNDLTNTITGIACTKSNIQEAFGATNFPDTIGGLSVTQACNKAIKDAYKECYNRAKETSGENGEDFKKLIEYCMLNRSDIAIYLTDNVKNKLGWAIQEGFRLRSSSECTSGQDFVQDGTQPVDLGNCYDDYDIVGEDNGDTDSGHVCDVGLLGWLVCPVTKMLGWVGDSLYGLISNMMEIKASNLFSTSQASFTAYSNFLPIANVILAIAFLVIIYSEATGNGFGALSNYTIKKMLPRLIIFAIMVNLSWWICAVAVDISNIIGANIYGLMTSISGSISTTHDNLANIAKDVIANTAVTATTATAVFALGGVAAFIPAAGFVVLVMLATFVIMIIRQALVVVLCIISPIAIALAVLPGTKNMFIKWRNLFVSLLIAYPAAGALFGAGKLAQTVLSGSDSMFMKIAAAVVLVVPLVALPFIIFSTLKGVPGLGNATSKIGNKLTGGAKSKISSRVKNNYEGSAGHRAMVRGQSAIARGRTNLANSLKGAQIKEGDKSLRGRLGVGAKHLAGNIIAGSATTQSFTQQNANKYGALMADYNNKAIAAAAARLDSMSESERRHVAIHGAYSNGTKVDNATMIAALRSLGEHDLSYSENYELMQTLAERRHELGADQVHRLNDMQAGGERVGASSSDKMTARFAKNLSNIGYDYNESAQGQMWIQLSSAAIKAMDSSDHNLLSAKKLNELFGTHSNHQMPAASMEDIDDAIIEAGEKTSADKLSKMSEPEYTDYKDRIASIVAHKKVKQSGQIFTTPAAQQAAYQAAHQTAGEDLEGKWSTNAVKALGSAKDPKSSFVSQAATDRLQGIAKRGGERQLDQAIADITSGKKALDKDTYLKVRDTYTGTYTTGSSQRSDKIHVFNNPTAVNVTVTSNPNASLPGHSADSIYTPQSQTFHSAASFIERFQPAAKQYAAAIMADPSKRIKDDAIHNEILRIASYNPGSTSAPKSTNPHTPTSPIMPGPAVSPVTPGKSTSPIAPGQSTSPIRPGRPTSPISSKSPKNSI